MFVCNGIEAMVGDVLTSFGRQHFKEIELIGVGFVCNFKASILTRYVWEPGFPLWCYVRDLPWHRRLRSDASSWVGFMFHIALNQYCILRISGIRINPILKRNFDRIFKNRGHFEVLPFNILSDTSFIWKTYLSTWFFWVRNVQIFTCFGWSVFSSIRFLELFKGFLEFTICI